MRILFYGGCHALIFKRLIDELGPPGQHHVDLLINFQLIGEGKPFPVEQLGMYDAVVLSPVENKGEHNTVHIEAACAAVGVPCIRFPWLEWHGYAPGADKDAFWGAVGWFYPGLLDLAREHSDFERFSRAALADFPSDAVIEQNFAYSTEKLVGQEQRVGCEVRVSDFILEGFRDRRMFLIPDHPTLLLYRHVMDQLERLLGARLVAHWPDDLPEPQPEAWTPILPRIRETLRLGFGDDEWRCETQPLHRMALNDFLALHFHRGRETAVEPPPVPAEDEDLALVTACRPTWIVGARRSPADHGPLAVPIFTQMLLRRGKAVDPQGHFQAEILAPLTLRIPPERLQGSHLFRAGDWLCRS